MSEYITTRSFGGVGHKGGSECLVPWSAGPGASRQEVLLAPISGSPVTLLPLSVDRSAVEVCREALARETMSAGSVFESSRSVVPVKNAGDATHYSEVDTAADRDARAMLEKNIRLNE